MIDMLNHHRLNHNENRSLGGLCGWLKADGVRSPYLFFPLHYI